MRTTVTFLWPDSPPPPAQAYVRALLFDTHGNVMADWRIAPVPGQPVMIDSGGDGPWRASIGRDGVLALYSCCDEPSSPEKLPHNGRLFPLIDWRSADGRIATLHSDQFNYLHGTAEPQRFTEIVVLETIEERNALILLNGESMQPACALRLFATNGKGEVLESSHDEAMLPFSTNRIELGLLFPHFAAFCDGKPATISGRFESTGLYTRPYVETTGKRWGIHHAGDVYRWPALPYFRHALISGEVNPAAVRHDAHTRTWVNILHSHDGHDEDVTVDVTLYDAEGRCVARRPDWCIARRNGLVRFDVADLLPAPDDPFQGHIALNFAPAAGAAVPCHLQALMEYRSAGSVARMMTWSDEWNSRIRLARRARVAEPPVFGAFSRVLADPHLETEFAVTNAGHAGYQAVADVTAHWRGKNGERASSHFELAPFATLFCTLAQLFPGLADPQARAGVVLIESESDLASMAFTRCARGTTLSAEHFMALFTLHQGELLAPAGS